MCPGRVYGGPEVSSGCPCHPGHWLQCPVISTVRSLAWKLVCIRALSLDHSSSSWGWRSLRQLLLILLLEALSRQFRTGVPWELNYADDLVLIVDTQEECITKRKAWKAGVKSKGFHVNMKKTKVLVSGVSHDVLKKSGKFHCIAYFSGVGNNSMQCSHCMVWVHKSCSGTI